MKKLKLISISLATASLLGLTPLGTLSANAAEITNQKVETTVSSTVSIEAIKPYVSVNNGHIQLNGTFSKEFSDKNQLPKLLNWFSYLNDQVDKGNFEIQSDLSIIDYTPTPRSGTYGKWTNHWWGQDRKFTSSEASRFAADINSVAAGWTAATALGFWIPQTLLVSIPASAFNSLVANRILANDYGNGVYVGITWVGAFNVEPL
ncbi:hypothetical protein ACWOB3_10965 [Enterococcus songbeiensis]